MDWKWVYLHWYVQKLHVEISHVEISCFGINLKKIRWAKRQYTPSPRITVLATALISNCFYNPASQTCIQLTIRLRAQDFYEVIVDKSFSRIREQKWKNAKCVSEDIFFNETIINYYNYPIYFRNFLIFDPPLSLATDAYYFCETNALLFFIHKTIIVALDLNECELDIHNCDEQATCTNSQGSYSCTCNKGWTGDGFGCDGIQPSIFKQSFHSLNNTHMFNIFTKWFFPYRHQRMRTWPRQLRWTSGL